MGFDIAVDYDELVAGIKHAVAQIDTFGDPMREMARLLDSLGDLIGEPTYEAGAE